MAGWLTNAIGNLAISWAAWAQNRYFEPEHYNAAWIAYSHDGTIELCEYPPEPHPGLAVWRRISDTEQYERVDVPFPSQEPPTPLVQPIIQAVVRVQSHGRRQRRSRAKPRDFDITAELDRFQGRPALDWLHVGMCVQHAHGIVVFPGQYTLSIIDGELNLHELNEEQAAVFSIHSPLPTPSPELPISTHAPPEVVVTEEVHPADDPEPDTEFGSEQALQEEEGDEDDMAEPDFDDSTGCLTDDDDEIDA